MTESMVYPCPKCGGLTERVLKRIRLLHPFAKTEAGQRTKTGMREVYHCGSCGRNFIISLAMVEVEVMEPAQK